LRVQDFDDYMNLINDEVGSCGLEKVDRFVNMLIYSSTYFIE